MLPAGGWPVFVPSLRRAVSGLAGDGFDPASATYSPTPPRPVETVEHLTEPIVYTIDARTENVWVYFDFSRGAVVPVLDPKEDAGTLPSSAT